MFAWSGAEQVRDGVRCRVFSPAADGGRPTAALYEPAGAAPAADAPLLLVQHGGSSVKEGQDIWDAAGAFAGRLGWRVVALDGPVHGARLAAGTPADGPANRARFFHAWEHDPGHVAQHVACWRGLVDELAAAWPAAPLRWFGVSMGTAYGLPLLAVEPRIGRAVLGMWGTSFVNSARLLDDAARVRCPVLFQQKWDDELFTREGQLALFDALGTPDKRLHAYPGGHVRIVGEQLQELVRFLAG
ncbi:MULTISPECIES: hypothetical protein [Ramlibacter]|uniref:Alpha/beta hydrolase n=1 Tax=Ramlibacter pinisoli TaxID=2682844 RepID=A0A6N8IV02_9BURK|nr:MULTISPECIES: hypothetical protein [Ramlibacter]MBA2965672.1 hypothetical protein [Ramlibacter sp. CGMCC 1.13660]MVQ30638.1 hypothetical protein [Ramlibacter pinisoli]